MDMPLKIRSLPFGYGSADINKQPAKNFDTEFFALLSVCFAD